jgi:hypothetical protein
VNEEINFAMKGTNQKGTLWHRKKKGAPRLAAGKRQNGNLLDDL